MILPSGLRQLALISSAGVSALEGEIRELVDDLVGTPRRAEKRRNAVPGDLEGLDLATYARDSQLASMSKVREAADKLEPRRRRRPLAAAEVRGDALHQVALGSALIRTAGLRARRPQGPGAAVGRPRARCLCCAPAAP